MTEQEHKIVKQIHEQIDIINLAFDEKIDRPIVTFDIRRSSNLLGETRFDRSSKRIHQLRFNKRFMEMNFDAFLQDVVTHEVAHIAVEHMFPLDNTRGKQHGKNFNLLVLFLGGTQTGAMLDL